MIITHAQRIDAKKGSVNTPSNAHSTLKKIKESASP